MRFIKQKGNTFQVNLSQLLKDKPSNISPFLEKNTEIYLEDFLTEGQIVAYRNRKELSQEVVPINEMTRIQILNATDAKRRARAKDRKNLITVKYHGITNSRGWIKFSTNSQYTPSLRYVQYVKLKEAKDMKYFKEFKQRDIIRLFMSGDLQVSCTCPDFRYRFKHMAHALGYGLYREVRFPGKANPALEGSVCKHLICVLSVINMNWTSIAKDMQKSKFFKNKMEDEEDTANSPKKTGGWKHKKK